MKKILLIFLWMITGLLADAQDKNCLEDLGDKLCLVSSEGKFGVMNKKGHYVVPAYFDEIKSYKTSIWVKQNGKCGVFDRKGRIIIPIEFPSVECIGDCDKEILFEIVDIGVRAVYVTKELGEIKGFLKVNPLMLVGESEVSIQEWFTFVQDVKNHGYNYNYGYETVLPDTNKVETKLLPAYRAFLNSFSDKNNIPKKEIKNEYKFDKNDFKLAVFYDKKLADNKLENMMNFPVTGITHKQAIKYVEWLTTIYERDIVSKTDLSYKVNFRLPTINEWEKLAVSGLQGKFRSKKCFDSLDNNGNLRFNYNMAVGAKDFNSFTEKYFGKGSSMVNSFWTDFNGIYGLFGNVAEMLFENGWAKGGSFAHYAKEADFDKSIKYEEPQPWLGFRVVAEFKARK